MMQNNSDIHLDPLKSSLHIETLKHFTQLIKTTIGPHGKLKLIQNIAGGNVTVTSSSVRLYRNLSVKNIFIKFILSSVKSHLKSYNNGGLYCGLLTLNFINNALNLPYPKPLIGQLFERLGDIYISCFNSNHCVTDITFSQLSHLQSLIDSIIKSKPACILSEENQRYLNLSLLKIFLKIIPSEPNLSVNKSSISFSSLEGISTSESKLYEGLLVRCPQTLMNFSEIVTLCQSRHLKVVLFGISLSGDVDFAVHDIDEVKVSVWNEVLLYMKEIVKKLIHEKVNLLACQKVVHPSLRKEMEDSGILVIDRLGSEVSKYLQYVSRAEPVLSLSSNFTYGSLTSLSQEHIGKNKFLLISNSSVPFWTLLICNYNEEAVNETKVICQQAIDCMFRLLKKPSVCFGGGCTEIYMMTILKEKVISNICDITKEFGCSKSQVFSILQSFCLSIEDVTLAIHQSSRINFATESVYHHLWKLEKDNFPTNSTKCMCGQYVASSIPFSQWKVLSQSFSEDLYIDQMSNSCETPKIIIDKGVLLDELSCKVNASFVAFQTASALLRTSVLINSSG